MPIVSRLLAEGEIAVFHQCKTGRSGRISGSIRLLPCRRRAPHRVLCIAAARVLGLPFFVKHFLHAQQVGAVVGYHTAGVTLAVIPVVYTCPKEYPGGH